MVEERDPPNTSEEQEPIGNENIPEYKSQKETLEAPLYGIPPNGKVLEEIKPPNHSKKQEPIGKENTLGYQIQTETLETPLDMIPPN